MGDPAAPRALNLLVAVDSASPNEDALRTLSVLIGANGLDITALYVEDEEVLRAATLPGLREISLAGRAASLDPARLAYELANEAAAARRGFEDLARRLTRDHLQLTHRFRIARGRLDEELERAAGDADFVMVTRSLRTAGLRLRLARSFIRLARQPRHILFVNEPWASGSSVVVLDGGAQAVDYAARLARAEGLRLVVIARGTGAATPEPPAEAVVRRLVDWSEEALADLCLAEDARLLVIPALEDVDCAELMVSLMDRLPCSVLKLT